MNFFPLNQFSNDCDIKYGKNCTLYFIIDNAVKDNDYIYLFIKSKAILFGMCSEQQFPHPVNKFDRNVL